MSKKIKTLLSCMLMCSAFACNTSLESFQTTEQIKAQQTVRAAIDFGSGAIKMQVALVDIKEGKIMGLPLVSKQISLNLTEDIAAHQESISAEMIQKSYDVLYQLKDEAIQAARNIGYSQVHFTGIATASFRKAKNGPELLDRYKNELGITFQILAQEAEGKLGFMTAKALFPNQPEERLIAWDNGNGSFQMSCVDHVYQGPTGFGVVRVLLSKDIRQGPVFQSHESGNPVSTEEKDLLIQKIQELLPPKPEWLQKKLEDDKTILVTFGEGKSLFPVMAQSLATLRGHPETVEEATITLDDLYGLCAIYLGQPDALFDQHGTYRNTLLGAIYVATVMENLGVDAIYYKRSLGNTSGILISSDFWADNAPKYLYKVLTVEEWDESQRQQNVKLGPGDKDFIHFSLEDQLERITSKYFANVPAYVILKVDTDKLPGRMVFETNPGGSAKYYHLYEGSIPMDSVVEAQVIKK